MKPGKRVARPRAAGSRAAPPIARPAVRAAERPPTSELAARLRRLDGRPFASYRTLVGTYPLDAFEVVVDHAPLDPASGRARLRLRVPCRVAGIPERWLSDAGGRLALEDLVARAAAAAIAASGLSREGAPPGSGAIAVETPGEAIVERGTCRIAEGSIELRVLVDLPAQRRAVRGLAAEKLLTEALPRLGTATLLFGPTRLAEAEAHVAAVRRHRGLQAGLAARGLVAFLAEGSFASLPAALTVELEADGVLVRGAGIPAGVTLIAGGGVEGRSALLETIAAGVHPHPPRDRRSGVVTALHAAVVRAERGRALDRADLSMFLAGGPASGIDPAAVTCRSAPAAIAQAAAAVEAIAAGATLLLVDEDDASPAFLARDPRMTRLLSPGEARPIPLAERARDLYDALGVSTIVAASSSGEWMTAAHTTLVAREGRVEDRTASARGIAGIGREPSAGRPGPPARPREPRLVSTRESRPAAVPRVALHGRDGVRVGDAIVDLGAIPTLVEPGQRRALAAILTRAETLAASPVPLSALLDKIEDEIGAGGLDALASHGAHDLARPRRVEIAAALVRSPGLAVAAGAS